MMIAFFGGPLALATLPGCAGSSQENEAPSVDESAQEATAPRRKPNIIYLMVDDMAADQMNHDPAGAGRNLSPNLDRLAAQGTILRNQYITAPVCTPSRYTTLTGKYPSRARNSEFTGTTARAGQSIVHWNTKILPDEPTLPKALKQAGYVTGMVGKNHLIPSIGAGATIAADANPRDPAVRRALRVNAEARERGVRSVGFDYAEAIYGGNATDIKPRELAVHNMEWVTAAGLDFIQQNKDRPFFLFFATTIPHSPLGRDKSTGADPRATPAGYLAQAPNVQPARSTLIPRLRAAGLETSTRREFVLWFDDAIGALMAKLRQLGLEDDTIIVFHNDNGQAGKGSVYDSATHSADIVWRLGGFRAGRETPVAVTDRDYAPTLLDLAGAPIPRGVFDGVSFKPALDGSRAKIHDDLFFELGFTRAVQVDNWKYLALRYPPNAARFALNPDPPHMEGVRVPPGNPGFGHIGGNDTETNAMRTHPAYFAADQLYDLSADPGERNNLAGDPARRAKLDELKGRMRAHLRDLPGGFGELK